LSEDEDWKTRCAVDIDIFSVSLFRPQPLSPQRQFARRQSRETMDAKKKTQEVETIKTKTGYVTVATRIIIGMPTKTIPTVNIAGINTRNIVPLLKRNRESNPRIEIGVTSRSQRRLVGSHRTRKKSTRGSASSRDPSHSPRLDPRDGKSTRTTSGSPPTLEMVLSRARRARSRPWRRQITTRQGVDA
jgi:hypothetical protein